MSANFFCTGVRLGWLAVGLGLLFSALASASDVIQVKTQAFDKSVIYPTESAPATVLSLNDATLSAETVGRIQAIHARVGDQVTGGASLLTLDCHDQQLGLQHAQAEQTRASAAFALAERQFQRAQALKAQNSISQELVDQRENEQILAEAQLASARTGLDEAKLAVSRCTVTAPFDGVVMQRLTQVGAWVQTGTPVLRVLDTEHLEISAQVSTLYIDALRQAGRLWLADDEHTYDLALREIAVAIDPQARSREVRLLFIDQAALPGTAGRLVWQDRRAHVPADLLVSRNGELGVFVAESGKARFIALPGAREGAPALATALQHDQRIITDGRYGLEDGDAVAE